LFFQLYGPYCMVVLWHRSLYFGLMVELNKINWQ